MGGQYSDFTNPDGTPVWRGLSDVDLWSHAHMSHLWDGGLAVFDNGFFNGDVSRAVEYAYDRGVTIIGPSNPPALVPYHASQMYSKNITTFLMHLVGKDGVLKRNVRHGERARLALVSHVLHRRRAP